MTKNREGLLNAIVHRDYYEEGSGIYAFYRLGITEKIGSGIARMREAMAERGIEITFDTEDFFIVTLTRPETIQKEVTDQVTDQVKKLLRALKTGEKSGKELIKEL